MDPFAFNPTNIFLDETTFVDTPATEEQVRQDFSTPFEQVQTYINDTVKVAVDALETTVDGLTADLDAAVGDVLSGKKFFADGVKTGTLALTGNAIAGEVLAGKTFYSNDAKTKLTGTIVNQGAGGTVTPSTSDQTKSAGYYSSDITISGDADLVAGNILEGKNIFGVNGTMKPLERTAGTSATLYSLNGGVTVPGTEEKLYEWQCNFGGSINLNFRIDFGSGLDHVVYAKVYKNGNFLNQYTATNSNQFPECNLDINISYGDLIQIYGYYTGSWYGSQPGHVVNYSQIRATENFLVRTV